MPNSRTAATVILSLGLFLGVLTASAQSPPAPPAPQDPPAQPRSPGKPDEQPVAAPQPAPAGDSPAKTGRLFGVIPNSTTVENTPETIVSIGAKEKFKLAAEDAFDTYAFPLAGIVAASGQARNSEPSWGQGFQGYAKRFGASYADTAIGTFMTTAVFPSLLREDPRYFILGHGGFGHRTGYALSRILIVRTDAGTHQFNYSEFMGNAAAAGISNLYHPPEDRSLSGNLTTWGTQMAIDTTSNFFKEFWPDVRRKLFSKKQHPAQ